MVALSDKRITNPNCIDGTDPSKWLCRKRGGVWNIWRPHEHLPVVQVSHGEAALHWRPPDGIY